MDSKQELEAEIEKCMRSEAGYDNAINVLRNSLRKTLVEMREIDHSFKGARLYTGLGKAFIEGSGEEIKGKLGMQVAGLETVLKEKEQGKLSYSKKREALVQELRSKYLN